MFGDPRTAGLLLTELNGLEDGSAVNMRRGLDKELYGLPHKHRRSSGSVFFS